MLPAFTYAGAIGNLWSICLGVNIFRCLAKSEAFEANMYECFFPRVSFIGNIPLLSALRVN